MSDDPKPTPPASGSGGSPATGPKVDCDAGPAPTKCCCCVTGATIQNVQDIPATGKTFHYGPDSFTASNGHSFDFVMTFNFAAGTSGVSDCDFEWNETVDVPAVPGHPANTETDLHVLVPTNIAFVNWNNRKVPCPGGGNLSITITDPPGLGNAPGRTMTRTLKFRLVAKSGSGCGCGKTSMTATATQVLVMVNGTLDTSKSSFVIGPSSSTP